MKIAITSGDPAGIGPELILRCAPLIKKLNSCTVFSNKPMFKTISQDLKLQRNFRVIRNMIVTCTPSLQFQYGKPTVKSGKIAMVSIDHALASNSDIIITPPIVKSVIQKRTPAFIGHTEYFARYYGTRDFGMVGIWQKKRIMLLTTHLPLRKVFTRIKRNPIVNKIMLLNRGLIKYFNVKKPCIGVSALNPHGFEFSAGEEKIIKKAIQLARRKNIDVHGPFPVDSLFNRTYDGYVTMYHDQAMTYLKSKKGGLNFTLGLPVIRLSPLYGAALDIAGTGKAEASGLENAIKMGIYLYKNARKNEKDNRL